MSARFWRWGWVVVPGLLVIALYLVNPSGWQIADDEGVYLYQAWRISLGEWPYQDFLTAQQPLFIGLGGLVMKLSGPSQAALRLCSQLAAIAAACLLGQATSQLTRRAWAGWAAALIFLGHPLMVQTCRLYLSEPFMLLGIAAGLNFLVRWQQGQRRRWLFLASLAFALATLFKLFALLVWAGAAVVLLLRPDKSKRPVRSLVRDGIIFLLPAMGLGVFMVTLERLLGSYLADTIGHHFLAGAGVSWGQNALNKARLLGDFVQHYPLLVILAVLRPVRSFRPVRFLFWSLSGVIGLFFMQRALGERHLLVFMPALAALSAAALASWEAEIERRITRPSARATSLLALVALLVVLRWLPTNLAHVRRNERQTDTVVSYLQEQTAPDAVVLSDYLELNFLSRRPTLAIAAGLHHTSAASGQIKASELTAQLGPWVVIDISPATGSTLVGLRDYPTFHNYLRDYFRPVATFERENQRLQVWQAQGALPAAAPTLTPQHPLNTQIGDLADLLGYSLEGSPAPNQTLTLTLFWQARAPTEVGYSVFVHLQSTDGEWVNGWDSEPLEGLYPTWRWWPGQIIPDRRALPLPADLTPGTYQLSIGMYDWRSGERLPASRAGGSPWPDDRITLSTLTSPGE